MRHAVDSHDNLLQCQVYVQVKNAIALIPASKTSMHVAEREDASAKCEEALSHIQSIWVKLLSKYCLRQKFRLYKDENESAAATQTETETSDEPVNGEGGKEKDTGSEPMVEVEAEPNTAMEREDVAALEFAHLVKGHGPGHEDVEKFTQPASFVDKKVLPYLPFPLRTGLIYFSDLVTLSLLEKNFQGVVLELESESKPWSETLLKAAPVTLAYCDAIMDCSKCSLGAAGDRSDHVERTCISSHLTLI